MLANLYGYVAVWVANTMFWSTLLLIWFLNSQLAVVLINYKPVADQ